jgi:hypothetical protein
MSTRRARAIAWDILEEVEDLLALHDVLIRSPDPEYQAQRLPLNDKVSFRLRDAIAGILVRESRP